MQSIQEQNIKTQTGKNVRQITPAFNIYIFRELQRRTDGSKTD